MRKRPRFDVLPHKCDGGERCDDMHWETINMTTRIAKTFDFDAAHRLPFLPPNHKCHRIHGHTYRCEMVIEGDLDGGAMIIDYGQLATIWFSDIHSKLDHRCLNDVEGLTNPTTEAVAAWIFERLSAPIANTGSNRRLVAVRVYESATTWAEVTTP